jgi:hypothetical protein
VASLQQHLETFTPVELYLLFQQNGLLTSTGKSKGFMETVARKSGTLELPPLLVEAV